MSMLYLYKSTAFSSYTDLFAPIEHSRGLEKLWGLEKMGKPYPSALKAVVRANDVKGMIPLDSVTLRLCVPDNHS